MPDPASDVLAVTDALARIAAAGDGHAVVSDDGWGGLYVQLVAYGPGLYGEAPGNGVLGEDEGLPESRQGDLLARGWTGDGVVNWSRTWPGFATDAARTAIAEEVLGSLRDAYGWRGGVRVEVETGGPSRASGGATLLVAYLLAGAAFFALWLLYFLYL